MDAQAIDICDPAVTRTEAHTPEVHRLVAGHLHEGPGYATYRSNGTTDWLLIHTVAGQGRFGTPAGDVLASPGQTTLIRPGTRHDYGVHPADGRWEILFAHFHARPEWTILLDWPERAPGIFQLLSVGAVENRIASCLGDAARLSRGALERRELFGMNALEAALLWCDTQNPRSHQIDERILRALEFIERNLAANLSVKKLATVSMLSSSRFAHMFRTQVGTSPQRFVEQQRLAAAAQLLDLTSRPIAAIAAEVGFTDPLYFSTRFRLQTGHSPRAFRARGGNAVP